MELKDDGERGRGRDRQRPERESSLPERIAAGIQGGTGFHHRFACRERFGPVSRIKGSIFRNRRHPGFSKSTAGDGGDYNRLTGCFQSIMILGSATKSIFGKNEPPPDLRTEAASAGKGRHPKDFC